MKVAILSCSENAKKLYHVLYKFSDRIEIVCVIEQEADKWGILKDWSTEQPPICISVGRAIKMYRMKQIDFFLMPSLSEPVNRGMFSLLMDLQVQSDNILYAPMKLILHKGDLKHPEQWLTTFQERMELETVEFHVADHCNLNCRHCSMFSGLVKNKKFPDLNQFKKDLQQLRHFFTHIKRIRIIGGEPFLNPELQEYLIFTRTLYPDAFIKVISNGLLIKKISPELIDILRKNRIFITITYYPCVMEHIEEINDFLNKNHILHDITPSVTKFQRIYDFSGKGNKAYNFSTCYWKSGCATMKEGKLATCFVPFVLPIAADAFSLDIKQSGYINLYEEGLTTVKIRQMLDTPFDMCRYCAPRGIMEKWDTIHDADVLDIHDWGI